MICPSLFLDQDPDTEHPMVFSKVAASIATSTAKADTLAEAEKDLTRRRREFAAIATNPEIQKLLATSEDKLPPAHTPEGIEARIRQGVAKGLQAFLAPMTQAAAEEDQRVRYMEFLDKNPEMKDPAVKAEVVKLVRERREAKP